MPPSTDHFTARPIHRQCSTNPGIGPDHRPDHGGPARDARDPFRLRIVPSKAQFRSTSFLCTNWGFYRTVSTAALPAVGKIGAVRTRYDHAPRRSSRRWSAILTVLISLGVLHDARATHISGGEITYACVGPEQYHVAIDLYYDCNASVNMDQALMLQANGNCGTVLTALLPLATGMPVQVTTSCPGTVSACDTGTGPGMQRYSYTGLVDLPASCGTWTLSATTCCRNTAIVNLQNPLNTPLFLETIVNAGVSSCNSSPVFTGAPIPVVCANQLVNFSFAGTDPDGDILTYQVVAALAGANTPVAYVQPPFFATNPIQGIALDPTTGQVTFTALQGTYVVAVLVSEWNSMGQLVGTVRRDMQFLVTPCFGTPPPVPASGSIDAGAAIPLGPFMYALCAGTGLALEAVFPPGDAGESLTLTSNAGTVLPGSTFTQAGTAPATATITWEPPPGASGAYVFTITATDDDCPMANSSTIAITVHLDPAILMEAHADSAVCEGSFASLGCQSSGGTGPLTTTWSNGLVGDGPHAVQLFGTETLIATVLDSLGCSASDSVTVIVHPLPDVAIGVNDPEQCLRDHEFVLQNLTPSAMVGNFCIWDLGDGTTANEPYEVSHSYAAVSCYDVTLTVTSPFGCVDSGTSTLCVRPHPGSTFTIGEQPTDVLWTHIPFSTPGSDSTGTLTVEWAFGPDGSLGSSTEPDPVFTFPDETPGTYPVSLLVTNIYGCTSTSTLDVEINGVSQVFIPTAFTPNGDGVNDEFFIVHEGIDPEAFALTVFDRWGAPVFRSSHPDDRWNGSDVPEGVYSWHLILADQYSVVRTERTGSVVLVR